MKIKYLLAGACFFDTMLFHMLSYNDVLPKKLIIVDGDPYEVLSAHIFRMQMRKPVNKTKIRNLKTGQTIDYTFHQPDKIDEAEVETKISKFIYSRNGEWWFHEENQPAKRFSLHEEAIGEAGAFLKGGADVEIRWFEQKPIQVKIPIKVELKVREAPPNTRGNTAQGGNKVVVLETGANVNVPMFINAGDVIRINTETGEYVERV